MHEVSICQSILRTVEAEFATEDLEHIREIHLRVGRLSNIEPELLKHVFKFIILDGPFEKATLHIVLVDIKAACNHCGHTFKVEHYKFVCPVCESPVSNVKEGKELEINKIILEEPANEKVNK